MIVFHAEMDVYEILDGKKHVAVEESYEKALIVDEIIRASHAIMDGGAYVTIHR